MDSLKLKPVKTKNLLDLSLLKNTLIYQKKDSLLRSSSLKANLKDTGGYLSAITTFDTVKINPSKHSLTSTAIHKDSIKKHGSNIKDTIINAIILPLKSDLSYTWLKDSAAALKQITRENSYIPGLNIDTPFVQKRLPGNGLSNSFKSISNLSSLRSDSKTLKDTISLLKKAEMALKLNTYLKGQMSLGYDYGVIPFLINSRTPKGLFVTEGHLNFNAFFIPLNAHFYYTDAKNISGLNNYFRISFDAQQFRQQLKDKATGKTKVLNQLISKWQGQKQVLLEHEQMLKASFTEPQKFSLHKDSLNLKNISKLTNVSSFNGIPLDLPHPTLDSLKKKYIQQIYDLKNVTRTDSIERLIYQKEQQLSAIKNLSLLKTNDLNDSLDLSNLNDPSNIANQINELDHKMAEARTKLNALKNPEMAIQQLGSKRSGMMQLLSHIQKFEIGLCYPNYSQFLINGTPLKGINIEWQNKQFFGAISYGKTLNNLFVSNDVLQYNLNATSNLLNYFNFNQLNGGRRIIAMKGGFGQKEKSHLFIGLLYGKGLVSYQTISSENENSPKEHNYVVEIDARIKEKQHALDFNYAKSYLSQVGSTVTDVINPINAILNTDLRSHAALIKHTFSISKTNTQISSMIRWVDPNFKSFGVGFIRSDNMRYEIKLDQTMGSKLKFSVLYKYEQDNLLKLYISQNTLQTLGIHANWKITKRMTARLGYTPVLHTIRSFENIANTYNNNYVTTAYINYTPKLKWINSTFSLGYNTFKLNSSLHQNTRYFSNLCVSNISSYENTFSNAINFNIFKGNSIDSSGTGSSLITDDITYLFKDKVSMTLGFKMARLYNEKHFSSGYKAKMMINLNSIFSIEASAEKLVIGEFYNNLNIDQIRKYPYYLHSKLIIKI
jgi:hypothetical protein